MKKLVAFLKLRTLVAAIILIGGYIFMPDEICDECKVSFKRKVACLQKEAPIACILNSVKEKNNG